MGRTTVRVVGLLILACFGAATARQPPLTPGSRLRGGASSRYARPTLLQPSDGLSEAERVYVVQQFSRPAVRTAFLARVYSTVMLQVVATGAIMAAIRRSPALAYHLLPRSPLLFLFAMAPAMAIQLIPNLAEQAPYGHLLLAAFTFLTGVGLGAATSILPAAMLLEAAVATFAAVAGLATYATTTKRDFTATRGMLSAGLLALLALGVLQFFTRGSWISMVRPYLGALVFSGYLVYDTQLIAGGGKRFQLRPNQHILGALMIFSDILNLFMTILQASARSERD